MEEQAEKPELITKIAKFLPSVEKPLYKQGFNERLKWTGLALLMYLTMSYITVFGLAPTSFEQFRFFEIVLGSKFGSLMTLGIGPIVTAGIILQLLVGSKIINWDMTKPDSRKKFQTWNKTLAISFAFIEATAFVLAGAVPVAGGVPILLIVILQLAAGGIIVILLDELVSKWGFGSGVSLFIAAGVGSQILVRAISPLAATCAPLQFSTCIPGEGNPPIGLLWGFLSNLISGNFIESLVNFMPLLATVLVFLLVIYIQGIKVEVPLAFSALRGFGKSWSLKLLYTSNIPVILTAALLANVQLTARVGISPTPEGLCGVMGCFDDQGNPTSGIVYYLSAPRNLLIDVVTFALTPSEVLRAFTYLAFLVIGSVIFSVFWVNTAGMDAKTIAGQIEGIGMQIPGYRRDPRIVESVLNRYIPPLSVLGGFTVGLLAALGDFTGAIGSGTGILLTVMIIYNYYEELSNQPLEDAHPLIRKLLGGE
ncbi:MAG: preprotein translocase subunit SecY [Candidatus Aenigmarchaeota archaeon]|nr:preprotein translocase subunit SecY [Candidatus Aenigmarchaeota archaeon]